MHLRLNQWAVFLHDLLCSSCLQVPFELPSWLPFMIDYHLYDVIDPTHPKLLWSTACIKATESKLDYHSFGA